MGQCKLLHLKSRRGKQKSESKNKMMIEASSGCCKLKRIQFTFARFEVGGRILLTKEWSWSLEAGKGKKTDSSLEPPERNAAL